MKKATWIFLICLTTISGVSFFKYFDKVFPIIDLNISMNRQQAQKKALEFAHKNNFDVQGYDVALQFKEETMLQAFVELEGGGKQAFKDMIKNDYYQPYQWAIRFYKPHEIHEYFIHFTPDGRLNEFLIKIPETETGAALDKDQALKIALDKVSELNFDISPYNLVENNMITQPSGRVDHVFVYEREDISLKKGKYRLKLKVFGDRFAGFEKSVKIPDEFMRQYKQMYADNKLIASVSQNIAILLYLFIIAFLLFLFFYHDWNYLFFKKYSYLMMIFALAMFAGYANNWSSFWNFYPTNISPFLFGLQQLTNVLIISILFSIFVGIICMLSDAADRYIFGRHIQFLKVWSSTVVGSYQIFEMTVLGYIFAINFLGYQILYTLWAQSMNWWSPLWQFFDPNILSQYVPFFTPLQMASRAGFWEEFAFRALPISGVAFLTRNSKYKKWWLLVIIILQAIIFGAVHANYPQQPAYNRIIEIFIPAIVFGILYYIFGLLPGIIAHFVYDAIWMCMPIWISDFYFNKLCAFLGIMFPLFLVGIYWLLQNRKLKQVGSDAYNDAIKHEIVIKENILSRSTGTILKKKYVAYITLCTVLGFIFCYFSNQWNFFNAKCQITAKQAVLVAEKYVNKYGFVANGSWTRTQELINKNDSDENKFIWQKYKGMAYQDLQQDYIPAHFWQISWKNFKGSLEDRAESFEVKINVDGNILAISHTISESVSGADLKPEQALEVALSLIEDIYAIKSDQLSLISNESVKHQNRRDYTIIYQDLNRFAFENGLGQTRIVVQLAGDQLSKIKKVLHVPEMWQRNEHNRATQDRILNIVIDLLLIAILLFAVYISLKNITLTIQYLTPILFATLAYVILKIVNFCNGWDQILGTLNTAEPWINQIIPIISSYILYFIVMGFVYLLIIRLFIQNSPRFTFKKYMCWPILIFLTGMSLQSFVSWFEQFAVMHHALDYQYQYINFKIMPYGMLIAYFLNKILFLVVMFMSFSTIAVWLTERKKNILTIISFFMMAAIVTSSIVSFSNIPLWIISGAIIGFVYYLVNRYIIFHDLESAFFISLGVITMQLLPSIWCQVYPNIISQFIISFIIFAVCIMYIYRKI